MDFKIDEEEIYSGKVVYFKTTGGGYGFIRPEVEMSEIYIHHTEIEVGKPGFKNLLPGDVVTFKIRENGTYFDKDGVEQVKYKAIDLNIVRTLGAN